MADDLVLTPGGSRPRSQVHLIESGAVIRRDRWPLVQARPSMRCSPTSAFCNGTLRACPCNQVTWRIRSPRPRQHSAAAGSPSHRGRMRPARRVVLLHYFGDPDPVLAIRPSSSCRMLVLMEHSAGSVARRMSRLAIWSGPGAARVAAERAGVRDALMWPVPVSKCSNSRRECRRRDWSQISVRSSSSRRQVCTQRSMMEFILGIWTPLSTVSMPASPMMASNRPGLPVPVPDQEPRPAAGVSRSITRFLAACVTQDAVGCAVAPRS